MSEGTRLDLRHGTQRTFLHVLVNTVLVSVMNFTLWFAVTFWVFLETRSVLATGMIAGIFLVSVLLTGVWFGSLVDHHRKRSSLLGSTVVSLGLYAAALGLTLVVPADTFRRADSVLLWVFVVLVMLGVVAGNVRMIATSTLVTLLVPADVRDRANGLVGTTSGVSFLVTSVISGLLVAAGGMRYALVLALVVLAAATVHLALVPIEGDEAGAAPATPGKGRVDLRGTVRLVRSVPGLMALILFTCVNNFLGGAFMALLDAYGLSLVSVRAWGLLWGVLSTGVIIGGLLVARVGLGTNPVRTLLLVNLVLWSVTVLFPLRSSMLVLAVGMYAYMLLMPFAEAAEQTILQRVVPYERQGRVFGFAQSVEQAASPLTAFLVGPLAQLVFIPLMTDGAGARAIGGWFGTGADRGIALVFVVTGVLGVAATLVALGSRSYRRLSGTFDGPAAPAGPAAVLEPGRA